MRAATAALTSTVDDRDQQVAFTFNMDLPGGIYPDLWATVEAIHVEGDTVTDAVAGTRLDDGYTAFEATVTVSGYVDNDETKTVAWLFARYPYPNVPGGTVSPLAYQDMHDRVVTIGFGPTQTDATEVFYGYVDSYTQNTDGQVEFTLIDCRTILRPVAELPAVITAPPYNAGLTSEFALDYLLRASSKTASQVVSSWPRRSGAVLAVGFRSSMWPEVGVLDTTAAQPIPTFGPNGVGSGLTRFDNGATSYDNVIYRCASTLDGTVYAQFLVDGLTSTDSDGDGQPDAAVEIRLADDKTIRNGKTVVGDALRVRVTANGVTVNDSPVTTTPLTTGPHLIGVTAVYTTDQPPGLPIRRRWVGTITVDGTATSYAVNTTGLITTVSYVGLDNPTAGATIAGLIVTGETNPTPNWPISNLAQIDRSLNPLQVIPPISGDAWQTIQEIASAELAVAGFFGGRTFRFYNRNTLTSRPIAKTVTSDGALETIGVTSERTSIINRGRVGYTTWTYATTRSTVYTATSIIKVPRNGTTVFTADLGDVFAVEVDGTVGVLADGVDDPTQSYMRVSRDSSGLAKHPGGVTATLTSVAPNKITVTFRNTSNLNAWLVSSVDYTDTPAGTPFFTLAGKTVTPADEIVTDYQWPPIEQGGAAASRFGEVPGEILGNPWLQDPGTALALCKAIVQDNYQPRCEFTNVAIRPDPRLEPADTVRMVDSDRTGVDEYVRLFGFSLDYEADDGDGGTSYEMSVNGRAAGPPSAWLLGVPGRSELGVTTYLPGART